MKPRERAGQHFHGKRRTGRPFSAKQTIRVIAEELDAHRKRVLAEHPQLTLTGLYNVLEKLRAGTKPDELDGSYKCRGDNNGGANQCEFHLGLLAHSARTRRGRGTGAAAKLYFRTRLYEQKMRVTHAHLH